LRCLSPPSHSPPRLKRLLIGTGSVPRLAEPLRVAASPRPARGSACSAYVVGSIPPRPRSCKNGRTRVATLSVGWLHVLTRPRRPLNKNTDPAPTASGIPPRLSAMTGEIPWRPCGTEAHLHQTAARARKASRSPPRGAPAGPGPPQAPARRADGTAPDITFGPGG
jgi:hypothetical protein